MDIDIDCKSDFDPLKVFDNVVKGSMINGTSLTPHPCGVYFQDIPTDPISGLSAIPYKTAEEMGYFKLDFLHVGVYDHFTSREEIRELIRHDPDWTLLLIPSIVAKLFQISKHYDLIADLKPQSVIELADCLALIRPQKRYLLKYYKEDRDKTREFLYKKEPGSDGYAFKKAHAIAYALVIVLELHLIKAGIL
jgi:DNA polymerase III alpha subunit